MLSVGHQLYLSVTASHYLIQTYKDYYLTAGSTVTFTRYSDSKCTIVSIYKPIQNNLDFCYIASSKDHREMYSTSSGSSSSSSLKSCFAGSETVTLESGEMKPISEVRAGDRVLAADASRQTVFSEVVFVPHGANADKTAYTHITTKQGRDIKMTHSHILPAGACASTSPPPDVRASSVTVGDCIMTVSGMEEVSAVETVQGQGLYTIVTKDEYVVVNGIIASPFAYNHMVANFYYNIHRLLYAWVPGLLTSPLVRSVNEVRYGTETSPIPSSNIGLSFFLSFFLIPSLKLTVRTFFFNIFITGSWTLDSTCWHDYLNLQYFTA
jgi:Hint module